MWQGIGSVEMQNCPTKIEFDAIVVGTTDPAEIAKLKIDKANEQLCAIITLEQKTDDGLLVVKKMILDPFSQGVAYQILEMLKDKDKPKDVTVKIELKKELEKVQFKYADDYYKDVISVTERYDMTVMETEILANKVPNST